MDDFGLSESDFFFFLLLCPVSNFILILYAVVIDQEARGSIL